MTSSPLAASSSSWMRLSPDLLWTDYGLRSAASSCHGGERFFEGALPGRTAHGLVGGARKRMSSCREARSYFTVSNTSMGEALAAVAVRQREKILARARQISAANLAPGDCFAMPLHFRVGFAASGERFRKASSGWPIW